jgi:hypothetical protein
MFENVVDLLYIRKAPVKRSRRYIQFKQVEKLLQTQKVLRKKRLPRGPAEGLSGVRAQPQHTGIEVGPAFSEHSHGLVTEEPLPARKERRR